MLNFEPRALPVPDARQLVVDLCRQFYFQGWCTGTGGGISVRDGERIYIAPSGVQKERIGVEDLFTVDVEGNVTERPDDPNLRISACTPLFLNAYRLRGAGAVLHSHSVNAMLATLISGDEFNVTHLEMQKGLRGVGYHDTVRVPIVENTAHECDLADALADAMRAYPDADAVLVRRHGVYVWGRDWQQAKTQAECYDYLFQAAVQMHRMGVESRRPAGLMAALPIIQLGHPTLRQVSKPVTAEELASPEMQAFIDDLVDTMKVANGAGLAAPQVDRPVRICAVWVQDNPRYPYKPNFPLTVFVNPVVSVLSLETASVYEGCLSVPDLRGRVDRHMHVRVDAWDRHGTPLSIEAKGLIAGTFQHEFDHLDGLLFVDRVTDPGTYCTWANFERFHKPAFVQEAYAITARYG